MSAKNPTILVVSLFLSSLAGCGGQSSPAPPQPKTFVLANFASDTDENLYIQTSTDSVNWSFPSGVTGSVYTPPAGHGVVRDPSIAVMPSNTNVSGAYVVAYTNTLATEFGLAISYDLVHWSWFGDVSVECGQSATWAPEWFIEPNGNVHIFVSLNCGDTSPDMSIYEVHPSDAALLSWSAPELIYHKDGDSDFDPFVVLDDNGNYRLFHTSGEVTSTSLLGTYTAASFPAWAPAMGWEGPSVIKLGPGHYRLLVSWDDIDFVESLHGLYYADSFDDMETWSTPQPINSQVKPGEHGTVIALP